MLSNEEEGLCEVLVMCDELDATLIHLLYGGRKCDLSGFQLLCGWNQHASLRLQLLLLFI